MSKELRRDDIRERLKSPLAALREKEIVARHGENPNDIRIFDPNRPRRVFAEPSQANQGDSLAPMLDRGGEEPISPDEDTPDWSRARNHKKALDLFRRAFNRADLTLGETAEHRLLVAWRVTREMGLILNLLAPEEMLVDAFDDGYSPFEVPRDWRRQRIRQYGDVRPYTSRTAMTLIEQEYAREDPGWNWPFDLERDIKECRGVALAPPPVPIAMRRGSHIPDDYEPRHDDLLGRWLRIVQHIAAGLMIDRDGEIGRVGLKPLLDPDIVRIAWPGEQEIIAFEFALVDYTLDLYREKTESRVKRHLMDEFRLLPAEVKQLCAFSKAVARDTLVVDVDEARAVHQLRLEGIIERAREELDLRAEIAALKQLAIIQGLGKVDPPNLMAEQVNLIVEKSSERAALRDANRQQRLLEG